MWPQKSRQSQATLDSQTDWLGHNNAGRIGNSICKTGIPNNGAKIKWWAQKCWGHLHQKKPINGGCLLFHQFPPRISGVWQSQSFLSLGREEVLPPLCPTRWRPPNPPDRWWPEHPQLAPLPETKNKQMLSKWKVFTTLLCQLAMIDGSIMLYPWNSKDYNTQPAILLVCLNQNCLNFWSHNLCSTSCESQVAGQLHPAYVYLPGLFNNPNILSTKAQPLATNYQTRIVAPMTPTSWDNCLLRVAPFWGPWVQFGRTMASNYIGYQSQSCTLLPNNLR